MRGLRYNGCFRRSNFQTDINFCGLVNFERKRFDLFHIETLGLDRQSVGANRKEADCVEANAVGLGGGGHAGCRILCANRGADYDRATRVRDYARDRSCNRLAECGRQGEYAHQAREQQVIEETCPHTILLKAIQGPVECQSRKVLRRVVHCQAKLIVFCTFNQCGEHDKFGNLTGLSTS